MKLILGGRTKIQKLGLCERGNADAYGHIASGQHVKMSRELSLSAPLARGDDQRYEYAKLGRPNTRQMQNHS